jgi:hypothetical protein
MSALYPSARQGFLTGLIDADTAVIKAALVRGYTYSAGHVYMSDVTGAGGTVAATATLTTITTTSGTLDSADLSFGAVAANANNHYVVLYQASAVGGGADVAATAQRLIAYIDSGGACVPTGAVVTLTVHSSGWFTL